MERAQPAAFGVALKRARLAADLTQEELAERAGVSVRTIGSLERGPFRSPRRDTRRLLETALGLAALDLAPVPPARQLGATAAPSTVHEGAARPLPIPPTPLIGREQEVQTACALLNRPEVHLLTLCGPPGVGKTRLALEVAAQLQQAFADGAVFVPLASISDPELVAGAIAQALGLRSRSAAVLREQMRPQRLLLVLDNFEQIAAAAPQVADLLAACPSLKILVTSRVAVQVRGEQEFPLPPLALPDLAALPPAEDLAQVPAVALFLQRAQAALPFFMLMETNAAAVAAICQRLDGLPLALELAAARLKLFSPQALLAQLAQQRLSLSGGAADLPKRQRTLRDALAWSYALLHEDEQALFRRLAVFAGGAPLEAVEPVCSAAGQLEQDPVEELSALVDHHLLRREEVAGSGEVRLGMLEMLREYALEQLQAHGEVAETEHAHAHYYLSLVETAEPELTQPQQKRWFERLARELENVRAALRWAQDAGSVELGVRLSGAFSRFWYICGSAAEGRHWLETFIAQTGPEAAVRQTERWGAALNGAGYLAAQQGNYERAEQYHREDLALCRKLGIRAGVAAALNNLGIALLKQEKYAETMMVWEESLAHARAMDNARRVALILHNLGYLAYSQGQYRWAAQVYEESLSMRRHLGNTQGIASTLDNWGQLADEQGEYAQAVALLEESLTLSRSLAAKLDIATSLGNLGSVAYAQGDLERAEALCTASLEGFQEIDEDGFRSGVLSTLGKVACQRGAYGRAAALHAESLALRRNLRDKRGVAEALADLGQLAQAQGVGKRAERLYREALGIYQTLRTKHRVAPCLEGVAALAGAQGDPERAARLLGAAAALRDEIGAPLPPVERAAYERLFAATRQALGDDHFPAARAAGRAMPVEELMAEAQSAVSGQEAIGSQQRRHPWPVWR